ncbi:MAG: ribokinase [Eubacterium sp.]|nr:ribokinase [Eubacterium sp.]
MKCYDLMLIGPATRDENIDFSGEVVREIGGAAFFGVFAAACSGADVCAAVKCSGQDTDMQRAFELDDDHFFLLPSAETTRMRNTYFTADRERRKTECVVQSDPISPEEIPQVDCRHYHLAGLLYGDFQETMIPYLKQRGTVSADLQGFLRHNQNGSMLFQDWTGKKEYLPYLDVLKADTAEAEILTGTADREEAARIMHSWGAKEILISNHAEMLVYDGTHFHSKPVTARNLSGRTGRGDTVFASYLARRLKGEEPEDALGFATAAVSMKMEKPGPLRSGEREIRARMKEDMQNLMKSDNF